MTYGLVDSPISLDLSPNSDSLQQFQPPSGKSNLIPLFDPKQPQSPHSSLVPHFIQVFVKHLGAQCPFITYDDALERFMTGILPPLLANSIASLAARFVLYIFFPFLLLRVETDIKALDSPICPIWFREVWIMFPLRMERKPRSHDPPFQ